jgi:uncharacterized protein
MNKSLKDSIFKVLKAYFANRPQICAVYLFGSVAKGISRVTSDIDLGILFAAGLSSLKRFEIKLEIKNDLEELLGQKVDIVDMESADLFFLHQMMLNKILFVDYDQERRVAFETAKRRDYFDRKNFYEEYHSQSLKRLEMMREKYSHG